MQITEHKVSIINLKIYWSLIVVETSNSDFLRLPNSLMRKESEYFDKICILLYGQGINQSLLKDLLEYSQDLPDQANGLTLPNNILHVNQDAVYLSRVISSFYTREQTKINLFGGKKLQAIYDEFRSSEEQEGVSFSQRVRFGSLKDFSNCKELDLFLDARCLILPDKIESMVVTEVERKILSKISQNSEQLPKDIQKLAHQVLNHTKGQLESMKITNLDPEKITVFLMLLLFTKDVIQNELFLEQIQLGRIQSMKELENFGQLTFNPKYLKNTIVPIQQKLPTQKSFQGPQNLLELTTNTPTIFDQSLKQQQIQTKNAIKQQQIPSQQTQQVAQGSQSQVQSDQFPNEYNGSMYLHIREVIKTFFKSFFTANTLNTKRSNKLVQIINNYSKNEVIRRSKSKLVTEVELRLQQEFNRTPKYHELTSFNVFVFLYNAKCVKLESDKEISYDTSIVEQYNNLPTDQVLKPESLYLDFSLLPGFKENEKRTCETLASGEPSQKSGKETPAIQNKAIQSQPIEKGQPAKATQGASSKIGSSNPQGTSASGSNQSSEHGQQREPKRVLASQGSGIGGSLSKFSNLEERKMPMFTQFNQKEQFSQLTQAQPFIPKKLAADPEKLKSLHSEMIQSKPKINQHELNCAQEVNVSEAIKIDQQNKPTENDFM